MLEPWRNYPGRENGAASFRLQGPPILRCYTRASYATSITAAPPDGQPLQAVPPTSMGTPGGRMEITLPGGVVLCVDADVDGTALRRVLAVLDRR